MKWMHMKSFKYELDKHSTVPLQRSPKDGHHNGNLLKGRGLGFSTQQAFSLFHWTFC